MTNWTIEETSDLVTFVAPNGFRFCYHDYFEVIGATKSLIGGTYLFWTNYGDSLEVIPGGNVVAVSCDVWTNKGFEGKLICNVAELGPVLIDYLVSKNDSSTRL
jgi:hypothetical protein